MRNFPTRHGGRCRQRLVCVGQLLFASAWLLLAASASAAADHDSVGLSALQVPADFAVSSAAEPPLVKYPMLATFDDSGRLFVCESAGRNLDAEQLLEQLPNFVRMLEDTDGDGRFDKSTIFADRLTLPSGAMWHDGALYVASPPSVWRLEDTDQDGVADRRDELITGFKFHGHAGDVHGPFLGPDGRMYITDGIIGHEIHDRQGRLLSQGTAARIFSARLDGSDLRTFCGGGMANPVAVTFTEEGEMLGATTFFQYNTADRIRHDALFHAIYGGVYPRQVGYLRSEFQLTGPLLPPLLRFGMSAPSNLTIYRSGRFGDAYRGNIFVSHFNTRCVTRTRLARDGSAFQATQEPFLVSTDPDFHPCDVIEDADGSLLVIDTGGWFKIGCPTSSLQPDVLGGIYRIRRRDSPSLTDPRGRQLAWNTADDQLVTLLADDRFAVRDRALETLARRGNAVVPALSQVLAAAPMLTRRNAVWTLLRIGTPQARAAARRALDDPDPSVRLVACRCAAAHGDAEAVDQLVQRLDDAQPSVRRAAATALGRIGRPAAITPLLKAMVNAADRMLEHAIVFALIEINDATRTTEGLRDPSARVRRAALVALDQMKSAELSLDLVAPLLTTDDLALQMAVVDVVSRHPAWVAMIVDLLETWLLEPELTESRRILLRDVIYAVRREASCQQLMAELLVRPETPRPSRLLILQVMIDSGFAEFPANWRDPVLAGLASADTSLARQSLAAIGSTTAEQFADGLLTYAEDPAREVALRVQAARILARSRQVLAPAIFTLLCAQCSQDAAFDTRLAAAQAIGQLQLDAAQRNQVIELVAQAGPLELPLLLKPLVSIWQDETDRAGQRLIATLESSPGFASLDEESLTALFEDAPSAIRLAAAPLVRHLKEEYATSLRQVLRTTFNLVGGDPVRGKEIFYGRQALCAACHRAGSAESKNIGPDLRRIGEVRSHRDLLEAILAPSASFARGFESQTVVTTTGRTITGVIHQETDERLVLFTSQREAIQIARSEIESIVPSQVSIMPAGLERTLTSDDLRDLLAFLSSLKHEP